MKFSAHVIRKIQWGSPLVRLNHLRRSVTHLGQEGFLVDFLQKKIFDRWVRFWGVWAANLLNDRIFLENLYRSYILFINQILRYLNLNGETSVMGIFLSLFFAIVVLLTSVGFWAVLVQ